MKTYKDLSPKLKSGYDRIRDIITDYNLKDTLEILEVLNNDYFEADYRKAYFILNTYFDSISNEEKPEVHEALKECGV